MSLGPVEIAVLGGAALLLFGPEQFPKVARKAGSFVREMQTTSQSFIREIERASEVHSDAGLSREDLIGAGSGAGPQAKSAFDPFAPVHGETVAAHADATHAASLRDDVAGELPPLELDDSPWGDTGDRTLDDESARLGLGSAIDPSATLILTDAGDVRHSVSVAASAELAPLAE